LGYAERRHAADGHADSDPYAEQYADRNSDGHVHADLDTELDFNQLTDVDRNPDVNGNSDANANSNADSRIPPNADGHGGADGGMSATAWRQVRDSSSVKHAVPGGHRRVRGRRRQPGLRPGRRWDGDGIA
jgi:hypothetical protein